MQRVRKLETLSPILDVSIKFFCSGPSELGERGDRKPRIARMDGEHKVNKAI